MGITAEEALGASMAYTNKKVSESAALHREIVNSLPATGDDTTIYMILDSSATGSDIYDEWMWINGRYEHIGSTRVDLTDYYNKTQVDTALSGKANTSDIPTALSQLTADSTHRLVTDTEKSSWNGKADWTTVTIPVFTPSQAGWRRICKIKTPDAAGTGLIYVGGTWSNGAPASALLSVSTLHSAASLILLSSDSPSGIIKSIRLVYISSSQFWVDVYFPAYSSGTGPHTLKFSGDIEISDIQNPISITTDTTAAAEVSLTQSVSGTVLTDKSDVASRVAATSFGSSVDITSSDPYTCPKDGYVSLVLANGAKGTVWVGGRELMTVSSSQGITVQSVFVKAGTSVRLTDASGTKYLYYEPLQY